MPRTTYVNGYAGINPENPYRVLNEGLDWLLISYNGKAMYVPKQHTTNYRRVRYAENDEISGSY